jgi:predicted hotdog family 3-hydroxylacyl-ACP dehydratase
MKLTRETIQSVIPQRPPFVMVDNLIEATPDLCKTNFSVTTDNIFIKKNCLQEPGLIENIAQTCAAGFGYVMSNKGEKPGLGFIGGINKVIVHELPEVNSLITTKVEVLYKMENIYSVKGENFCNGKKLLECELKIVLM